MKRRSVLASMGAFTASGSLVMGSGAFTSAEVERDVNVDVVGDENAFLGLVYDDIEAEEPPDSVATEVGPPRAVYEETLVELRNQFSTDITVDDFVMAVETDDDVEVDFSDSPTDPGDTDCAVVGDPDSEEIERGECAIVRVNVECPVVRTEEHSATVSFGVAVSGTGVSAETTTNREVVVTCPESAEAPDTLDEGVTFTGASGNAILQFDSVTGESATVWGIDNSGSLTRDEIASLADARIRPNDAITASDKIAAVYFDGSTYFHQGLQKNDDGNGPSSFSIAGGSGSNSPTPRVCDGEVDLKTNPSAFGCWNVD